MENSKRRQHSEATLIQQNTRTDHSALNDIQSHFKNQIEGFTNLGSSWVLTHIIDLTVSYATVRPLIGSSYTETPEAILGKHEVINVQNFNDNFCFRWAV